MPFDILKRLSDPYLKSKIDLVNFFINRVEKSEPNEEFRKVLIHFLHIRENIPVWANYHFNGPKYSMGCLVSRLLYGYTTEANEDNLLKLLTTLRDFLQSFETSETPLLKMTKAVQLIECINAFGFQTFSFPDNDNVPLRIYIIPFQHAEFNALYYPPLNTISMHRLRETKSLPEYIFVHEFGHLLIHRLTGDPGQLPTSFLKFNDRFNPGWTHDLIEIFCDLFSVAVMMDTSFASKNPFVTSMDRTHQDEIKQFFSGLVKEVF